MFFNLNLPLPALLPNDYNHLITNYRIKGDGISLAYIKLGTKVDLVNLKVADITDDEAFYGPNSIAEYYAHFINR